MLSDGNGSLRQHGRRPLPNALSSGSHLFQLIANITGAVPSLHAILVSVITFLQRRLARPNHQAPASIAAPQQTSSLVILLLVRVGFSRRYQFELRRRLLNRHSTVTGAASSIMMKPLRRQVSAADCCGRCAGARPTGSAPGDSSRHSSAGADMNSALARPSPAGHGLSALNDAANCTSFWKFLDGNQGEMTDFGSRKETGQHFRRFRTRD